jgi:glycosyltransferase involved in cell wall biosynthesis
VVIVSLTTTPPNMFGLSSSIDKLLFNQTVTPDLIVVNVCDEYSRFNMESISLSLESTSDKVIINPCVDSGPATKLLGLFEANGVPSIDDDDIIIVIDDDHSYPRYMVEEYLSTFDLIKNDDKTVLGVVGSPMISLGVRSEKLPLGLTEWTESRNSNLKKVGVLQGWGSYSMKGAALKKLKEIYSIHHFPNAVFYHDDLFISNIMNKYFDLRVVQTEKLWHRRSVKDNSRIDSPLVWESNRELRANKHAPSTAQMHNDASLGGASGDDGNLEKNLKSLSLYIKKGLLNIGLDDERKKEILFHDFVYKNGNRLDIEDLEGMTLRECIDHIENLDKPCTAINLMYELMKTKERDSDKYIDAVVALIERFGVSKGITKFLDRLPFSVRQKRNMKAAVIFHFPIDGRHGCHTRAMESIRGLVSLGMEVHIITKNQPKGDGIHSWSNEAVEDMKQAGVMVLDIFDGEEDYEWPSVSWSSYVKEKLLERDYDFILVNYEDVLTEDTYKLISNYPSAIDTHDNIKLNKELQDSIDSLENIDDCRKFYHRGRNTNRKRKYSIPRIYISEFEYENLRLKGDAFIPHVAQASIKTKSFLGNPMFLGSNNVFNKMGIDILDEIIEHPLNIFGLISEYALSKENKNFNCEGYQEDTSSMFETACFSMCPLFLGTGSKIKIQESLANATPVVAMIDSGLNSDIVHGVNGFLCYTTQEFKEYCDILYHHRDLCSKMGKAAAEMNENKASKSLSFKEYFEILLRIKTAKKGGKNAR